MADAGGGIRVISFDGPALDASGLSELLILEDIAGKWAWDRGDDREGRDVCVSELCDIVGGTGIGGFYAILFSLHMTIGQVIASHKIIQTVVFSSIEWKRQDTLGCATVLETALAQIVEAVGLDVDLDRPFLSNASLKCFVCVLNDLDASCARSLRNYRVRSSKSPHCSIREAIHATLADGVHLPSVYIQDEQFIMGSSGFANPSYELMKELPVVFPKGSKLACFINLGACHPGTLPLTSRGSQDEQTSLLHCAEIVAQNLLSLCAGLGPCYFRLAVATRLEGFSQPSAHDAVRVVKSLTMGYLEMVKIRTHLDGAVDTLIQRNGVVSLERLGSLAAEDGNSKLNAQIDAVHDHVVHMKKVMDDDIYRKIKTWLAPIDQTAKLDACIRARSPSTCCWIWDSPRVVEWKKVGGIFWCHAGMGAGKTVIASHVTETLMKVPEECFVAYYYFEFTNPSTLSEEALFCSVVSQLSHASSPISRQFYEHHRNGSLQPQLSTLRKLLRELVVAATQPIYLIVDALDELSLAERRYLLQSLLALAPLAADGFHVMVTSRDEVDIHEILGGNVSLDFPIEKEMVHNDITAFVDQQLAEKKWQSWPKPDVVEMRTILIDKADGMFRMVACQFEVLNQTQSTEDMRRALASLPATLSDTYNYILNTIPSCIQARSHTLLCILSAAFKPVPLAELSELLAVELGDRSDPINLPVYSKDLLYHEPQNIIGLGTALVRRSENVNNDIVLELSHASVKEYLLQGTRSWFPLDEQLAHETTARACLALLINNEIPRPPSEVKTSKYTISHWWKHIRSDHSLQLLSQQLKLFEAFPWRKSSIGSGLSYHRTDRVSLLKSPLIFAAGASLEQLLSAILESPGRWKARDLDGALEAATYMESTPNVFDVLITNGGDINSIATDGNLLLHKAMYSSQLDLLRNLIKCGADVNLMRGKYGSALQAAAGWRALNAVQVLVKSGADVNMRGGKYGSALHAAAASGALNEIEFPMQMESRIYMARGDYRSALRIAASQISLEIVQFLVRNGANVNLVAGDHGSALHAAADGGFLNIVHFLVEKGADVNVQGRYHGSALQAAAGEGFLNIVQFLIEKGADVNAQGGRYGSALQAAAKQGSIGIIQLLLEKGADVNVHGGGGPSALQIAADWEFLDIVQFLLEKGADVNLKGGYHGSALQAAVGQGPLNIVQLLVEKGADVNAQGGSLGSALQAAVDREALEAFEFLMEKGADVNIIGGQYGSALQAAENKIWVAGVKSPQMYRIYTTLLEKGAVRSNGTVPTSHDVLEASAICGLRDKIFTGPPEHLDLREGFAFLSIESKTVKID
ncbi:hypothetical protein DL96DRAFT_1825374 [Flagelloscypha sp. PMI_526]|nr:hypothetical protein DL96DRAFT_1825374 [Flagelloscypha sp. PMI_526]